MPPGPGSAVGAAHGAPKEAVPTDRRHCKRDGEGTLLPPTWERAHGLGRGSRWRRPLPRARLWPRSVSRGPAVPAPSANTGSQLRFHERICPGEWMRAVPVCPTSACSLRGLCLLLGLPQKPAPRLEQGIGGVPCGSVPPTATPSTWGFWGRGGPTARGGFLCHTGVCGCHSYR